MKTKMTAVAMVAVMIVAAFAVVGMADSGAADNTPKNQKNIIGTEDNPYALKKGSTVTAKIDYNYNAFTSDADRSIDFVWSMTGTNGGNGTIVSTGVDNGNASINGIYVTIAKNDENNAHIHGVYTVSFKGNESNSLTNYTKIDFTLKITDKTSDNKTLPEQTFTFTAYLIVVADSDKTIQLYAETGPYNTENGITFAYEKSYNYEVAVTTNTKPPEKITGNDYKYYATGLPDGLSMTVDGKIGGKLSGSKNLRDGSFTIFAVSKFGDIVSKTIDYTISASNAKDFTISGQIDPTNNGTVNLDSNPGYVTIKVKSSLKLTIEPRDDYTLSNLKVTYSGKESQINNNSTNLTFDGTGVVVVTVSANVGHDNEPNPLIVKTFTVYVVGEIFNTDLDPEVTN